MHDIPKNHPRYVSLRIRQKMVSGHRRGLAVSEGLLAHGRGEAFDYILGEKTHKMAMDACRAAAAVLLLAHRPVISVNGNTASLVPDGMVRLSRALPGSVLEVNLFHRTEERAKKIASALRKAGAHRVLGANPDAEFPGLASDRRKCSGNGMLNADVVLVPLEDGDRAGYLKKSGKTVIAIDLNPMSRTSICADITIVDNIVRALPRLLREVRALSGYPRPRLRAIVSSFDNRANLAKTMELMLGNLRARSRA